VKEFVVYTALRLLVFLASLLVVGGIWALVTGDTQVPALWVVLLAFLVSGVTSVVLLRRPREAFARRVAERADAAAARYQESRAKED
jgi:membrane protein implicated in regulation of membrane protease activity